MEKIRTFELDRWSEPDEQHRVRHIGMADAKETFEKLETHLKEKGMLPDEYFLYDVDMRTKARELPDFNFAMCVPNFGGSEGIYLDIDLIYCDEDGKQKSLRFATGKTLQEGADAFFWMSRIAAECSLMLNGRGRTVIIHTDAIQHGGVGAAGADGIEVADNGLDALLHFFLVDFVFILQHVVSPPSRSFRFFRRAGRG